MQKVEIGDMGVNKYYYCMQKPEIRGTVLELIIIMLQIYKTMTVVMKTILSERKRSLMRLFS